MLFEELVQIVGTSLFLKIRPEISSKQMFPGDPRAEEIYFLITLSLILFRRGQKGACQDPAQLRCLLLHLPRVTPLSDGTQCVSEDISFPNTHPSLCVTSCKCTEDISPTYSSAALNLELLQRGSEMHPASFLNLYNTVSLQTQESLGNL